MMTFLEWGGMMIIVFMSLTLTVYGLMLIGSTFAIRRHAKMRHLEPFEEFIQAKYIKPVSILVPAYNESASVTHSIDSLLTIAYPEYEIIAINDGSTDDTLQHLLTYYDAFPEKRIIRQQLKTKPIRHIYRSRTHPHLVIIDKVNGGKADALNVGINASRYPYIGSLDADSMIERDAFMKVLKPILESEYSIIATGGSVRVANGNRVQNGQIEDVRLSERPLVLMQVIEYLRSFLIGRVGLSQLNLLLIVSGAFGVFEKKWVLAVNGYAHTIGEDMELIVKLHRHIREEKLDKQIQYVPDSICWTEAPETITYLGRQRKRWQKGLIQSLWKHKKMFFNPKYGSLGLVSMPYYVLIEWLGPIVEFFGYLLIIFTLLSGGELREYAILFFFLSVVYGSISSMMAVLLEEWTMSRYRSPRQFITLFLWSMTESIWYRPLTVWWRVIGMIELAFGKAQWGEMKRKEDLYEN